MGTIGSAAAINDWVKAKTEALIKDLVSPSDFNSDTRIVLVNAIYLKAKWEKTFEPKEIRTKPFHTGGSSDASSVQMMQRFGEMRYAETSESQILQLPYEGGASMFIFLPKSNFSVEDIEKKITGPQFETVVTSLGLNFVNLSLPKFKFESTLQPEESLRGLPRPLERAFHRIVFRAKKLLPLLRGNSVFRC